jgi:hypothetical protein
VAGYGFRTLKKLPKCRARCQGAFGARPETGGWTGERVRDSRRCVAGVAGRKGQFGRGLRGRHGGAVGRQAAGTRSHESNLGVQRYLTARAEAGGGETGLCLSLC